MAEIKKHSLAARILLSISVVAIIILSGVWIGQALIARKITALLEKGPISLDGKSYITEVGKIRVDLTRRSITLSDITLRTETSRNTQDGPATMLDVNIPKITASGIRYDKGDDTIKASVYIRKLALDSPSIIYGGVPQPEKKKKEEKKNASYLKGLLIKQLVITDGNIRISRWMAGKKTGYTANGLNLELLNVMLGSPEGKKMTALIAKRTKSTMQNAKSTMDKTDSAKVKGKDYFSAINLTADRLSYTLKNGALILSLDTLSVNSQTGMITAGRLAITPQYPKHQYNNKVGDHTDWISIVVNDIALSGVKMPFTGNNGDMLYADKFSMAESVIRSYKNRNQIQSPKIKPTLYQSIERIPLGIDITSVNIAGLNVHYEEVAPGEKQPGQININGIDAEISGLTNRPSARGQHYTINASGEFLGVGRLTAVMTMPADSLNDHFAVRATLGAMPASTFSSITEPLAGIRITSGKVRSANVSIEGNSDQARSSVELSYEDLMVAVLNRKKNDSKRELLTFIANDIVLHHNNPSNGKMRIGEGEFERDKQKSFWNYIWKTTFVGLKKVVL